MLTNLDCIFISPETLSILQLDTYQLLTQVKTAQSILCAVWKKKKSIDSILVYSTENKIYISRNKFHTCAEGQNLALRLKRISHLTKTNPCSKEQNSKQGLYKKKKKSGDTFPYLSMCRIGFLQLLWNYNSYPQRTKISAVLNCVFIQDSLHNTYQSLPKVQVKSRLKDLALYQ